MLEICHRPGAHKGARFNWLEQKHQVYKFRRFYPAGPLPDGGVREHDLVQFFAVDGGMRTVRVRDLTLL